MTGLDTAVLLWLNRVAGETRLVVEVAYFLDASAATLIISVLVMYFLFETRRQNLVRQTVIRSALAAIIAFFMAEILASEVFFRPPLDGDRLIRCFFVVIAVLVGLSGPIGGDNWPSDILASFVLGVIASQFVRKLTEASTPFTNLLEAVNRVEKRWFN